MIHEQCKTTNLIIPPSTSAYCYGNKCVNKCYYNQSINDENWANRFNFSFLIFTIDMGKNSIPNITDFRRGMCSHVVRHHNYLHAEIKINMCTFYNIIKDTNSNIYKYNLIQKIQNNISEILRICTFRELACTCLHNVTQINMRKDQLSGLCL